MSFLTRLISSVQIVLLPTEMFLEWLIINVCYCNKVKKNTNGSEFLTAFTEFTFFSKVEKSF